MGFFNKKSEPELFEETNDLLIVFNQDSKTSDVVRVTDLTADSVTAVGLYKIPIEDCEITNSKDGRNFFYRAPAASIVETKRLAQLEKSMVLKQITEFKPPVDTSGADFGKISMLVIVVMLIIVLGFSACSGT